MKKPTLHIMRGLPGSGKSTQANKLLNANDKNKLKIFRINRDSLRKMLAPNINWSPEFEEVVKEIERNMAQLLIAMKFDVIIDDTNLESIEQYTDWKSIKSTIQVHDFRKIDVETCLIRNEIRRKENGNFCSPEIIVKLAKQHKLL